MKNLSILEPQIEKHHAYKKKTCTGHEKLKSDVIVKFILIILKNRKKLKLNDHAFIEL